MMTLQPKSPRVGRSPKLKAKWLSNTLAYQYGNNGTNKKSEIIVLSNDLDQYLQEIFQSIDQKGHGKITTQEFKLLCDILYLKDPKITSDLAKEMNFAEFHKRLCEHFACHGDFTGFLVNQNFRTINVNNRENAKSNSSQYDVAKRTEFQKKIASKKNHTCVHDAELFKNWDKLRLSGFRLSEMRENIDLLLYEVTFHKEEAESLKEIIEDLRAMLQASDAQNIGLQVAMKKCQQQLLTGSELVGYKESKRLSLPVDGTQLSYKPLKGEEKSVRLLARELTQLRDLRDKEVGELINFNSLLQNDITDLSREICRLEDENKRLSGQLESIVTTYNCCRQLFAVCVESFREAEANARGNVTPTSTPTLTLSPTPRKRTFSFKDAKSTSGMIANDSSQLLEPTSDQDKGINCSSADDQLAPEALLIKRLEHEINEQREILNIKIQDIEKTDRELAVCRRHLQTANFQVEALETECSRLLSMEDQLVSVFRLLQKGRTQCLSRKTLGQLLLDVIDSSFGEDMSADQFIRCLQQTLTDCPLLLFST